MSEKPSVLIVDNDPELRSYLQRALSLDGYPTRTAEDAQQALELLASRDLALLVADVFLKGVNGVELLKQTRQRFPSTRVVLMGRDVPTYTVVSAIQQGALDFVEKPIDIDYFLLVVQKAVQHVRLTQENLALRRVCDLQSEQTGNLVAESNSMRELLKTLELVAPTDLTVLIEGESGVGKELVANRLHTLSERRGKPFVAVNCGAIQETLLESELFGHEKGAFTGATSEHKGLFEVAHGGTLFLDEIGEMGLDLQVKLLRVLERSEFRRVGGNKLVQVDLRVIAATNKRLSEEVKGSRFREDLFYRLNVIHLEVMPLRERVEDIAPLVEVFLASHKRKGLPSRTMAPEALEVLQGYGWPGNVRELRNVIERCMILCRGDTITADDLPGVLMGSRRRPEPPADAADEEGYPLSLPLAEVERRHILSVFAAQGQNKVRTAKVLGINVKTLYNKLKSYEQERA